MLNVTHLSKRFGNVQAVKDVSFHVKKGTTFAFLGTNGAGKSTVIHMISQLVTPDHGEIIFSGGVLQEVTGIVFQGHRLDEELSLEENLMIRAKLYGMSRKQAQKRIDGLLELTQLSSKRDRLYGNCSGGEKRKTDILRALVHEPRFLILDEPTTGLDAESREEIWTFLRKRQKELGLTIFLTTHYIEEAEHVDQVLIMHEGKVEVEGTPQELKEKHAKTELKLYPIHYHDVLHWLQSHGYAFETKDHSLSVHLNKSHEAIPILHALEEVIFHFSMEEASLEQVFLTITEQMKRGVER